MQHNYSVLKKENDNPYLRSKFGGEYYIVYCSCGLFGAGKTANNAMEHINNLHEHHTPTLLFVDPEIVLTQLDTADSLDAEIDEIVV